MSAHIIHISHVCANTYEPRLTSFFWILEDGVNSLKFPVQKMLKCHKLENLLNHMFSFSGSWYICSIRRQSDRTPQRTPPRDFPDGYQPMSEKIKVVMYLRQQLIFVSKYTVIQQVSKIALFMFRLSKIKQFLERSSGHREYKSKTNQTKHLCLKMS